MLWTIGAFRSNNEALGECNAAVSCCDGKDAKSLNGRRGMRPLSRNRPRPVLM